MEDSPGLPATCGAGGHLKHAAWVCRGHDVRLDGGNVARLAIAQLLRGLWLDEVVDAGAAATDLLFRKRQELDARNRPQEIARRLTDALRVREMTRIVVSDAKCQPMSRRPGRTEAGDHLGHVVHARRESARPRRPSRIVR